MEQPELRDRMGRILEAEDAASVDWHKVGRLTDELYASLAAAPDTVVPQLVDEFLSDADIRAKDAIYARRQREGLRHYVKTGEYVDSTPLPRWACALTILTIGGIIFWALI